MMSEQLDEMQRLIDLQRQTISAMQAWVNMMREQPDNEFQAMFFDRRSRPCIQRAQDAALIELPADCEPQVEWFDGGCSCLENDPYECVARRCGIIYPAEVSEPCGCSCHEAGEGEPYNPATEAKIDDAIDAAAREEGR